eukprot:1148431-Pelagomonas_calceolata.AAC.3
MCCPPGVRQLGRNALARHSGGAGAPCLPGYPFERPLACRWGGHGAYREGGAARYCGVRLQVARVPCLLWPTLALRQQQQVQVATDEAGLLRL